MTDELTPGHDEGWLQAQEAFGLRAVEHVLGLEEGERPNPTDSLRWEVVRALGSYLQVFQRNSVTPSGSLQGFFLTQTRLQPSGSTLLEACRRHFGGWLPEPTDDPLVDALGRLVFNGLVLEAVEGNDRDRLSISAAFQDPVIYNPAAEAFMQDPDLSKLFPDGSSVTSSGMLSATSLLWWTPWGGGTTYLQILLGSFVEQTLSRMRLKDALNEESIEEFVRESLEQLRLFARQETVPALVLVALPGISVAEPFDNGDWGIRDAKGLAVNHGPFRDEPEIRSVLWMKIPHRLISISSADLDEEEMNRGWEAASTEATSALKGLFNQVKALQLGLIAWSLDQADSRPLNVLTSHPWSLLPISQTSPPFMDQEGARSPHRTLTQEDLEQVARLTEEFHTAAPNLDLAISRIIRVASEYRDPVDSLIDAVIALESMLGASPEIRFRVSAAVGWLLKPTDAAERLTVFNQVKKIYNTRSKLVHGASAGEDLSHKESMEALRIAIQVLRRIQSNPDLRNLQSEKRNETILLSDAALIL